jgi:hypothetical protein
MPQGFLITVSAASARTILLLLLISAPASAQLSPESGLETVNYKYVSVVIEGLPADAGSIGLTKDRVQTRVELRLRSAGLTLGHNSAKNKVYLYVNVNVSGGTFATSIEYKRLVDFTTGNRLYRLMATTWEFNIVGTHGRDAAYIMNGLDQYLDKFLNEYLKANQK